MWGGASLQRRCRPWGCWVRLPRVKESIMRALFILSCFSTHNAGLLALKETLTCWRATLASAKTASWPKRSLILTQRLRSMLLRGSANPALPGNWLVSGLVYDVTTGLVDVVVPPAPLRNPESNE